MRFIDTNISTLTVLAAALGSSWVLAEDVAQSSQSGSQMSSQSISQVSSQSSVQGNPQPSSDQVFTETTKLDYVSCPTSGEIKCVNDFNFMVCENGYWRASRKCADGTFCKDNMCVNADYVPSSVIYGGNGAHISNSQGGETVQGSGVIPGGGTTPTGEVVQGSGNSDAGSYNSGVVYETITSTSCEGVSETGELSDYDETTELGNDLDTNESEGVNVSKVDTVNGSNNPDEYQGLNEDSTKESGATSRILAVNGFGTFASLVSAVVVSAVLSFA